MIIDDDDFLEHYGTKRHSGRYPWGSGEDEIGGEHTAFVKYVKDLRKQGLTDADICRGLGIGREVNGEFRPSTGKLRAQFTIAKAEQKQAEQAMAWKLKDKGLSNGAIAERMKLAGESSVRALLAEGSTDRANVLMQTSTMLKNRVDEDGFIDVGKGVENYVGISKERLSAAVAILQEKGYELHSVKNPQIGTGFDTEHKVLCKPGTTWGDAQRNRFNIKQIEDFTEDGGHTYAKIHEPLAINPKRVDVKYKEDGGEHADGVIYVRPGKEDISLGGAPYAQVRIKVGNDHYLKGMAMYKDDLPDGVDLQFNTNKSRHEVKNKLDAMKKLTDDPELPFGSVIRQIVKDPGTSKERVTSAMNIVGMKDGSGEAGAWGLWSKNLSSQFLSKQSPTLAKNQLNMTFERRKNEFDEIMSLTNPTIKKKLLEKFAESTDSAAVHLKAAALPRQSTHVILPINSMKPSEVYAPNFRPGERVVLVRYPHGGTFEIPELTVNNRNKEAKDLLGNAPDAIGIHHSVAKHLSGADFDGDAVIVIPNNSGRVRVTSALHQLKNFDPRESYPPYDGMKTMDGGHYNLKTKSVVYDERGPRKSQKGKEMGDVSNLITDMTIKGASHDHIARAVKHSMVVIDAEKHHLDYKRSAIDHGIPALKAEYQGGPRKGASTLISKKKQTVQVLDRKGRLQKDGGPIDRETGRRVFVDTNKTRVARDGTIVPVKQWVKKFDDSPDLHEFSSGTTIEKYYADHGNRLKNLANTARLESLNTPRLVYSKSANKTYKTEVDSLTSKLALAERNAPRERQAQLLAKAAVKARKDLNPNLEGDTLRKVEYQELTKARIRMGAGKSQIEITEGEWNAIQAGAISDTRLKSILDNANLDTVRTLATPRVSQLMTSAKTARARDMLDAGYPSSEVADQLGVSVSTLNTAIAG